MKIGEFMITRMFQTRANWMKIINDLGMNKCNQCGYDKCFAALDFHHRNPLEKKYNIGQMIRYPVTEERIHELKKCIVLCANCHRELHFTTDPVIKNLEYLSKKDAIKDMIDEGVIGSRL